MTAWAVVRPRLPPATVVSDVWRRQMSVLNEACVSSPHWERASAIQPGAVAVRGLAVPGLLLVVKGSIGLLS